MTKIVYNACYGGFGLSDEAIRLYLKLKNIPFKETTDRWNKFKVNDRSFSSRDIARDDAILVEVIEKLGDRANDDYSKLVIEDLEPGTLYRITEYDGYESIERNYDVDWKVA